MSADAGDGKNSQRGRTDAGEMDPTQERPPAQAPRAGRASSGGPASTAGHTPPYRSQRRSASPGRTSRRVSDHVPANLPDSESSSGRRSARLASTDASTQRSPLNAPSRSSIPLNAGPQRPRISEGRESNLRSSAQIDHSGVQQDSGSGSASRRRHSRRGGSRSPSLSPKLRSRRSGRFDDLPPSPSVAQGQFSSSSFSGPATSGSARSSRGAGPSTLLPPPPRLPTRTSRLDVPLALPPLLPRAPPPRDAPGPSRIFSAQRESEERIYSLRIAQEPTTGAAFGTNLLARLPISPLLVTELHVTNRAGKELSALDEMPFLICQVSLITEDLQPADTLAPANPPTPSSMQNTGARTPISASASASASASSAPPIPPTTAASPLRTLYGTLAASPQQFSSPSGYPNTYFLFPEISVRCRGRFRLRALLLRIPNAITGFAPTTAPLAQAVTNVIEVVTGTDYVAPEPTEFTLHLQRQGAALLGGQGPSQD